MQKQWGKTVTSPQSVHSKALLHFFSKPKTLAISLGQGEAGDIWRSL